MSDLFTWMPSLSKNTLKETPRKQLWRIYPCESFSFWKIRFFSNTIMRTTTSQPLPESLLSHPSHLTGKRFDLIPT